MSHLLEVKGLTTAFTGDFGKNIPVDHIDFHVDEGEVVCIVGESGCGKSVTSLSIMGLLGKDGAVENGSVLFANKELTGLSERELDKIRGSEMTMIFQDPLTCLNPVFTIGWQIEESIRTHMNLSRKEAKERAKNLLKRVGMPDAESAMKKFPHMLSGGMRQRAMIAMALSCNPKLLIADEPTTALDVTIQAQIMKLLQELCVENKMSMILITHDIGLVAQMADRVMVMYAGQIVEEALVEELFSNPKHPYTKALLNTVPTIMDDKTRELFSIPGMVPENYDKIEGCRFAGRCAFYCQKSSKLSEKENESCDVMKQNPLSGKSKCDMPQKNYEFGPGHWAKCVVMKEREMSK